MDRSRTDRHRLAGRWRTEDAGSVPPETNDLGHGNLRWVRAAAAGRPTHATCSNGPLWSPF